MPMAPSFDVPGWFASGPGVLRRVGEVLLDAGGVRANLRKLIIVDDGSKDASRAVIQKYATLYSLINFQCNPANFGAVRNWNRCLACSSRSQRLGRRWRMAWPRTC